MIIGPLPNRFMDYVGGRGMWVTYCFIILVAHLLIIVVFPFLSNAASITITNFLHAIITYMIFHASFGVPYPTDDQEVNSKLTAWEQIDIETQYTPSRKFLTIVPIILFLRITNVYASPYFYWNLLASAISIVPKLPMFHRFRLLEFLSSMGIL